MKTPPRLQLLVSEIIGRFPEASLEFDPLPSGVCLLDVWFGRRNFVLNYSPTRGTGVSETLPDTAPFTGPDTAFASLDEAAEHFKSLLTDAARTEVEHLPKTLLLHDKPLSP